MPDWSRRDVLTFHRPADPPPTDPALARMLATTEYLASFENCYALLDEARPFLKEEAERLGIPIDKRDELDVLRDVLAYAETPPAH